MFDIICNKAIIIWHVLTYVNSTLIVKEENMYTIIGSGDKDDCLKDIIICNDNILMKNYKQVLQIQIKEVFLIKFKTQKNGAY